MPGYQELDMVVLQENVPEEGLRKGMIGTVLLRFDTPHVAYETEFCDENGRTIAQLALLPEQIAPAARP